MAKKDDSRNERKYLRAGAMVLLVAVGVGAMAGMAIINGNAKPNRDMKWYVRDGAAQVAAPPLGEGYGETRVGSRADAAEDATEPAETGADGAPVAGDVPADSDGSTGYLLPVREPEAPTQAPTRVPTEEPTAEPAQPEATEAVAEAAAPSGPVTIKITAAGDCTFGGEVGSKGRRRFTQLAEQYGYDYFFQGVRSIFEDDDLTIVNLEGPLTNEKGTSRHGFVFKGDPDYVNILSRSSVELCNLANNHTMDYGKTGLLETAQTLDAAGVGYCGYGQVYNTVIKGVRVSALGFTWWDADKNDVAKAVAEASENCDLLIVNMHWGTEGHREFESKQQAIGHAAIDAGADLVIGTHPHVYQGIEKYKDKYIVYSLGNFCFAGNADPSDKRCLIFQQTFSFTPGMGIVQAGKLDDGINIIPATVSSVDDLNDFQPTVMDAEAGAALLRNVAARSENFTFADTLWMKDNYMLANGLLKQEDDAEAGEAATEDVAEGEAA